jgi:hypothetical protein
MKILYSRKCGAYELYAATNFEGESERTNLNKCRRDFKDKKRYKKKLKRDRLFRFIDSLFHLDRNDFWRQIRKMERSNQTVNKKIEKLQNEYMKIFNESNCNSDEEKTAQMEVDSFVERNSKTNYRIKIEESVITGMINELRNGKAVELRGISNEMIKHCLSSKLIPLLTRLYNFIVA